MFQPKAFLKASLQNWAWYLPKLMLTLALLVPAELHAKTLEISVPELAENGEAVLIKVKLPRPLKSGEILNVKYGKDDLFTIQSLGLGITSVSTRYRRTPNTKAFTATIKNEHGDPLFYTKHDQSKLMIAYSVPETGDHIEGKAEVRTSKSRIAIRIKSGMSLNRYIHTITVASPGGALRIIATPLLAENPVFVLGTAEPAGEVDVAFTVKNQYRDALDNFTLHEKFCGQLSYPGSVYGDAEYQRYVRQYNDFLSCLKASLADMNQQLGALITKQLHGTFVNSDGQLQYHLPGDCNCYQDIEKINDQKMAKVKNSQRRLVEAGRDLKAITVYEN